MLALSCGFVVFVGLFAVALYGLRDVQDEQTIKDRRIVADYDNKLL
jgi:hypothetical protein